MFGRNFQWFVKGPSFRGEKAATRVAFGEKLNGLCSSLVAPTELEGYTQIDFQRSVWSILRLCNTALAQFFCIVGYGSIEPPGAFNFDCPMRVASMTQTSESWLATLTRQKFHICWHPACIPYRDHYETQVDLVNEHLKLLCIVRN